ncbi:MAG: carboxypeptidase-like regulatory domain-containing protein [Blastocatellia bacterium]
MQRINRKLFFLLTMITFLCLPQPAPRAQTVTSGAIRGVVYEFGTKTPLIAATVTVTNRDTGLVRTALTDAGGEYFIKMLPVGIYTVNGSMPGYEVVPTSTTNIPVRILNPSVVTPPPVELRRLATTAGAPAQPPAPRPAAGQTAAGQTAPAAPAADDVFESEQLVNTTNASRTQHFDLRHLAILPLPGIRTFDDLALLAPGVAPPPAAIGGVVGPGIGAGVGTSGQFAVNGIRSRANNFTIDGSDNNDEDIGVRRQGFTSLIPQSIESMQAVQITTLLPEPQLGRNMGAQINGVSRSGGTLYHGTLYGFYTDRRLRARDAFDLTDGPATFPITRSAVKNVVIPNPVTQRVIDNRPVLISRRLNTGQVVDTRPLAPANPVGGENPFTRGQYGFVFGGPVVKEKTHFFVSYEHQDINAAKESHFAAPTVVQRGLFESGDTGLRTTGGDLVYPTSVGGNAFLSLYPFANNPRGPYGANTYTAVLPASASGTIFSGKVDQNIKAFDKDHILSARYNFTDDDTVLPVTGEAIFSSLRAQVRTQNLSFSINSVISPRLANQFRASYGRTTLGFQEVRDPFLLPGGTGLADPGERAFLLNAPLIYNTTLRGGDPSFHIIEGAGTESVTGPIGQVMVSSFSSIGVDVFNFPQGRTNNTFQFADTLIYDVRRHRITTGFDIRPTRLNSFLNRNFRPVAVFNGAQDVGPQIGAPATSPYGFYLGRDYLAAGAPTGFFQTLASGKPDSNIRLRYLQNNLFLSDQIRVRPNFTVTLGARYELNTVPSEVNRRIESTFNSPEVQQYAAIERELTRNVFGQTLSGFESFVAGRFKIYKTDANNIAPHIAFAWDPFKNGKTSIRAGYGMYYDQILGAVISQSRNVFPTFMTVNFGGYNINCAVNPVGCSQDPSKLLHPFVAQNPAFTFAKPGTLNQYNGAFGNPVQAMIAAAFLTNVTTGPGFILPDAHLETPYTQQWGLTIERELKRDFLFSVGYVGTRGVHLLRSATPNLGPNAISLVSGIGIAASAPGGTDRFPVFNGISIPPNGRNTPTGFRPFPLLGSFTSIESDANSSYHSLQAQFNKRFSHGIQLTTAYTWSHAIDEGSDLFDLAGTLALPQNSFDRRAERGSANFDVRHRFVYSAIWDLPVFKGNKALGGWQLASIGSFQTGQPYSVLLCCDLNQDGNLTDRFNPLTGRYDARNTYRAPGIATVDLAANKIFAIGDRHKLEFRSEFFNLFNRTHFGFPRNRIWFADFQLEPLTQKSFTDTRLPARTIQFALKYSF